MQPITIECYIGAVNLSHLAKALSYSEHINNTFVMPGAILKQVSVDLGVMTENDLAFFTHNIRPLYLMNGRENVQSSIYFRSSIHGEFCLTNIWDCQIEVHPEGYESFSVFWDYPAKEKYRVTLELTARD